MSKFNPFDPANGYSEEDRVALETKCASLINRAYRNPFPGASLRHDGADNAGIFFAKQLAHIKTKAYDKEFPELSGLKLFPQTSDTDEGASYTEYYSYEPVGFAAIIANYASDLPRVDVKGTPHRQHRRQLWLQRAGAARMPPERRSGHHEVSGCCPCRSRPPGL